MCLKIKSNLIFNYSVDELLEKIDKVTYTENLIDIGILPMSVCDEGIFFTGKVSKRCRLFLINKLFDATNPLILLDLGSLQGNNKSFVDIKVLPNIMFLFSYTLLIITFLIMIICLGLGLFKLPYIANIAMMAGLVVILILIGYYMIWKSKKTLKIVEEILQTK